MLRLNSPKEVLEDPERRIVRKATLRDIPALLQIINGYAAQGVMLPRTEFEMSENIRDFTVALCRRAAARMRRAALLHANLGRSRSLAVAPVLSEAALDES